MPLPDRLDATHLRVGVVPLVPDTEPDDHRPALAAALDHSLSRIDLRDAVIGAWRDRLRSVPPVRQPRTLQETVQAARARLRDDRIHADTVELVNRRFVLTHVREGLG